MPSAEYLEGLKQGLHLAAMRVLQDRTPIVKTGYHEQYNKLLETLANDIEQLYAATVKGSNHERSDL